MSQDKPNKSTITFDKYIYFSELLKKLKKRHEGRINIGFHRFEKSINCREDCPGGDKILFVNSNLEISPCSWIDKITKEYTSPIKSTYLSVDYEYLALEDCPPIFRQNFSCSALLVSILVRYEIEIIGIVAR